MNTITKTFNGRHIGIIEHEGELWLTAVNVAKALGYGNSAKVIHCISPTNVKRIGNTVTFNEAGMRELAANGRKTLLPQFSQWAAREVFARGESSGCPLGTLIEVLQQMQRKGCVCSCSSECH